MENTIENLYLDNRGHKRTYIVYAICSTKHEEKGHFDLYIHDDVVQWFLQCCM
jgi:hypothetical protein